jgi:hypothetical protein
MKGAESVGPPCVASVLKPHPQVVCGTPPRIYLSQHVGLYFARSLAKVEKFGIKMQLDCWQMIEFVDLNQVCGCECCCLCSCRCVMCLTSSGDMPGGRRNPILAVTWQQKTKNKRRLRDTCIETQTHGGDKDHKIKRECRGQTGKACHAAWRIERAWHYLEGYHAGDP